MTHQRCSPATPKTNKDTVPDRAKLLPEAEQSLGRPGGSPETRTHRRQNPRLLRNLSRRLAAPAKGNGRTQKRCKRLLWASDREVSTSEAARWANVSTAAAWWALRSIADRVGRAKTIGRPMLWRLREEA